MDANKKKRIAVTGLGVISPTGNDVATFWAAMKAGVSGAGPVTRFDASRLESRVACEVKGFEPGLYMEPKEARKMALFSQFAVAAAVQAWRDAGFDDAGLRQKDDGSRGEAGPYASERIGVVLGNGIGGIEVCSESHRKLFEAGPGRMLPMTVPLMISNEAAGNVAIRLGLGGPALTAVTACASGTDALGQALDLIRAGRCDAVLAGGTEARHHGVRHGRFLQAQGPLHGLQRQSGRGLQALRQGKGRLCHRPREPPSSSSRTGTRQSRAEPPSMRNSRAMGPAAMPTTSRLPDPLGRRRRAGHPDRTRGFRPRARPGSRTYNAHGTSTRINDPVETLMVHKAFGDHAAKLRISSTRA